MNAPLGHDTEHLLRELAPQVLGAVVRRYRDFGAAEDAVQDALVAASQQWPRDGVPDNPRGWLIHVASRRMTDHIRSEVARRRRESEVATAIDWTVSLPDPDADIVGDDTLLLLFTCCHSSLTPSSAIALTLRAVGGLTTAEIARAFLVPEATMAQRISRAKQTIKASGVRLQLPDGAEERSERLTAVLHVLYLIFNEGYTSSAGDSLQRDDLSREAIRLTRALSALGARPGRGRRAARADAVDRREKSRAHRAQRRADSAHRSRSHAVGSRGDRGRRGAAFRGAAPWRCRPLPAPGGDRGRP